MSLTNLFSSGSASEDDLLAAARMQVARNAYRNRLKSALYDGKARVRNLEIAVPPALADIGVVSDWPKTVVDIRHERMQFRGWADDGKLGMDQVFTDSRAALAISEATLDSMTCGVAFVAADNLESPELTAAHPSMATILWDNRRNRPVAGYRRTDPNWDGSFWEFLYLPGETVVIESSGGKSATIARLKLPAGMLGISRIRNRLSPKKWSGASEITPAVVYYTHAAVRTMLGMEVNREYYIMPKRWAMNADMELFGLDENSSQAEKKAAQLKAAAGEMLAFPPPEPGDPEIKVGEFSSASPVPFTEQLRVYSQMLSSATGIPAAYLGFETANLPSGDSLRAWQERLVRSVENMQELANPDLMNIGILLHSMFEGAGSVGSSEVDRRAFAGIVPQWRDASSPTKAADADAATKLASAGFFSATSRVARERVGLAPAEIARLEADDRRLSYRLLAQQASNGQTVSAESVALASASGDASGAVSINADDVKKQADALGVLIRAGVEPEDAAARVGLGDVEFTGAVPTSLRQPETAAEGLED
ncbi:hypothetical protein [Corynebacterium callunae]|uniref:hypothetical protein n=1 Tax=Corynebacterium callunae TaxID=1721 RepID=UPI001FFEAE62|nr:hypothetical protein [Corynebacterium callunae]MCK2200189.1 hypothetical protein [Corynebacterium callunae]